MKRSFFLLFTLINFSAMAQKEYPGKLDIIPQPASTMMMQGSFTITPNTYILIPDSSLKNSADFFNDYLQKNYGFKLKVTSHPRILNTIIINGQDGNEDKPGHYSLIALKDHVTITGENKKGAFYGIQTLIQMLPTEK